MGKIGGRDIDDYDALLAALRSDPSERCLIGIVGPPASGKSTLAHRIAQDLGPLSALVPMDGFHLDNPILDARGDLGRKGAPHTFDAAGFLALVHRLKAGSDTVYVPIFDRATERTINAALEVAPTARIIVLEGNYLMLDAPIWREISDLIDISVFLDVSEEVLKERLLGRWDGLGPAMAEAKIEQNDLPNARLVQQNCLPVDINFTHKSV